ncbi:MAG: TatD family hydrolase [Candidatus Micrarchaeaceae archaeon]
MEAVMFKKEKLGIRIEKSICMLADAHAHIDALTEEEIKNAIVHRVNIIIANGGSKNSNRRVLEISDGKHVFPALGIDPINADMKKKEIEEEIDFIRENAKRAVAIGEVGIDYTITNSEGGIAAQKEVFNAMAGLAAELKLPLSIHCRGSNSMPYSNVIDEIIEMLENNSIKKAHFHFFSGKEEDAKKIADLNYFISVPPLRSQQRIDAIAGFPLPNIMAETDSPAVGKSPIEVEKALKIIAEAKKIEYEQVCKAVYSNTEAFFNLAKASKQAFIDKKEQ